MSFHLFSIIIEFRRYRSLALEFPDNKNKMYAFTRDYFLLIAGLAWLSPPEIPALNSVKVRIFISSQLSSQQQKRFCQVMLSFYAEVAKLKFTEN